MCIRDREDTVRKRLEVYSAQTRPLVDYYSAWAAAEPAVPLPLIERYLGATAGSAAAQAE